MKLLRGFDVDNFVDSFALIVVQINMATGQQPKP